MKMANENDAPRVPGTMIPIAYGALPQMDKLERLFKQIQDKIIKKSHSTVIIQINDGVIKEWQINDKFRG